MNICIDQLISSIATDNHPTSAERDHIRPAHQHRDSVRGQRRPDAALHLDQGQAHLQSVVAEQPRRTQVKRRHAHHHESDSGRPRLVPVQCDESVRHGAVVYHTTAHGRALAIPLYAAA